MDVVVFGYLQTAFSFIQLMGGPIIGRVCDFKGARFGLQLAQFGSGLSYLLLGSAASVPALFASRLPTLLMHTMHCCQAFLAVLSLPESRTTAMGRLVISCTLSLCCFTDHFS